MVKNMMSSEVTFPKRPTNTNNQIRGQRFISRKVGLTASNSDLTRLSLQ
jgi:hypothetical protein